MRDDMMQVKGEMWKSNKWWNLKRKRGVLYETVT